MRSTNHDSSVSLMLSDATLQVTSEPPAVVVRETIGSFASGGRSLRIRVTASRTSSSARAQVRAERNSMLVVDAPSSTVEVICSMPAIVATASSTLRVISDSICVGATPGYVIVTITAGNSMSGRSWTPSFGKLIRPATVSADEQHDDRNGIADRPGDEVHEPASELTLTRSPSFKKPAPLPTIMLAGLEAVDDLDLGRRARAPVSTRRRSTRVVVLEHEHVAIAVRAHDALRAAP